MAINAPTNYIFQVYLTEAAAIAGDTSVALRIDNTDGSIKMLILVFGLTPNIGIE